LEKEIYKRLEREYFEVRKEKNFPVGKRSSLASDKD
jgi:hypothetical protein